jgi:hypothetical protein
LKIATSKAGWFFFSVAVIAVLAFCYWQFVRADFYRVHLWRDHEEDYQTLVAMLENDRILTFINDALTTPADLSNRGITPQRISSYRSYMSKIHCGAISFSPGAILFISDWAGASNLLYNERDEHPPRPSYRLARNWFLLPDQGPF